MLVFHVLNAQAGIKYYTRTRQELMSLLYFIVIAFHFENTANKVEGHKVTSVWLLPHPFHDGQDVHHIPIITERTAREKQAFTQPLRHLKLMWICTDVTQRTASGKTNEEKEFMHTYIPA